MFSTIQYLSDDPLAQMVSVSQSKSTLDSIGSLSVEGLDEVEVSITWEDMLKTIIEEVWRVFLVFKCVRGEVGGRSLAKY